MRKAKEHSTVKESLLDVATDLMLTKGYEATAIDEICARAKLTKGSFFHYFKSKEDLAKALLTRKCAAHQKSKEEIFGKDPLKRVYGQIDMFIEMSKKPGGKGCLKGAFAHELSDTYPAIRRICVKYFDDMARDFAADLREAKLQYAPKASFDPLSVARYFVAVAQGSMILVKAYQDNRLMTESLKNFRRYIEYLFEK